MRICGIYKIVNTVNNKVYVGSSIDIFNRLRQHRYKLKAGIHDNPYLQSSYNFHGKDNFTYKLVEECDFDDLTNKENHYIQLFKSAERNSGFNLALVNEFRKNIFNEETKIKNSKYNLKFNGNFVKFKSINLLTGEELEFDNLVDAANYLIGNGFSFSKPEVLRQQISDCLRKVFKKRKRGGIIKRTVNKHKWIITQ